MVVMVVTKEVWVVVMVVWEVTRVACPVAMELMADIKVVMEAAMAVCLEVMVV